MAVFLHLAPRISLRWTWQRASDMAPPPTLTSDEALDLLIRNPESYKTPEELRSLASRVDADSPGKITVLYNVPVSKDLDLTDQSIL